MTLADAYRSFRTLNLAERGITAVRREHASFRCQSCGLLFLCSLRILLLPLVLLLLLVRLRVLPDVLLLVLLLRPLLLPVPTTCHASLASSSKIFTHVGRFSGFVSNRIRTSLERAESILPTSANEATSGEEANMAAKHLASFQSPSHVVRVNSRHADTTRAGSSDTGPNPACNRTRYAKPHPSSEMPKGNGFIRQIFTQA